MTSYKSIEATGVPVGGCVKCVDDGGLNFRFTKDATYEVISFCGSPHVRGHSDYGAKANGALWVPA